MTPSVERSIGKNSIEATSPRHIAWSDHSVLREAQFSQEGQVVHPLQQEIWSVLESLPLESNYTPDRARQWNILRRLKWDTLVDDLRTHLGTVQQEQEKFAKLKNKPKSNRSDGEGKVLRGKVFETLINADPAFGERSDLEMELLALAHNPDKFGLQGILGYYRNPDMAFIVMQMRDSTVIEGIGEAKLGLINDRAYKQLSETGFARGVEALVSVVNTLQDPARYGLVEVARVREQQGEGPILTISPEFNQLLVVPANRKVEWKSKLINYRDFRDPAKREDVLELLGDPERVIVRKAAFSAAEVIAISRILEGKI